MTDSKREQIIDRLHAFEDQAGIAIRTARKVRKALQSGAEDEAERECGDLDFAISGLNSWIELLPKARLLNKTCSQCKFFSSNCCAKAGLHSLCSGNNDACEFFSLRKGDH